MMAIPQDPAILLSYINTQLRDYYSSLEVLCKSLDYNQQEIEAKLAQLEYRYDSRQNRFI